MKPFKIFVAEDQKTNAYKGVFNQPITNFEDLRQYSDQISAYYNGKNSIFRGMKDIGQVKVADGNKINRRSAYAQNNLYTILMSEILPSWKEYPKRTNSFICSSRVLYARFYGETQYHIIPLENQKIVACSSDDIWQSFPNIGREIPPLSNHSHLLNSFNGFVPSLANGLSSVTNNVVKDNPISTRSNIVVMLNSMIRNIRKLVNSNREDLDDAIVEISKNWYGDKTLDDWLENDFFPAFKENPKLTMVDYLDDIMNPVNNYFQLLTPNQYYNESLSQDNLGVEVWLSGLVLCVRIDVYAKLIRGLGVQ